MMMNRLLEADGTSDDVSDWGSDFDEDIEDGNQQHNSTGTGTHQSQARTEDYGDLYEVPDGKPAANPNPTPTIVPNWLKKVTATDFHQPLDENLKPSSYIEHVLLPTRASKDDDSKNFIETLKRKLSQKHLRQTVTNSNPKTLNRSSSGGYADPKPAPKQLLSQRSSQELTAAEHDVVKKVKESLYKVPWFYRVDRNKAELILENYNSDGSFLVRECHHGGPKVPFTLTIRFRRRLFHVQIRIRPDVQFALGSCKQNEMHFSTVQEMIDTYRKMPLQLHSNGEFFGETKLTHPPIVYSYSSSSSSGGSK